MSPSDPPLLISIPDAIKLLRLSRTSVYKLFKTDPDFPPRLKVMGATRIEFRALLDWIEQKGRSAVNERNALAAVRKQRSQGTNVNGITSRIGTNAR